MLFVIYRVMLRGLNYFLVCAVFVCDVAWIEFVFCVCCVCL